MASNLFHRIVVPTDFSECAEGAWMLAKRVGERCRLDGGTRPSLRRAVRLRRPVRSPRDTTWQLFEQGRKWVEDDLEKWAAAARLQGMAVRTIVRTGSARGTRIVNLATDGARELIIMGTHGRTGLNRLLLGSVADRVIRLRPAQS